MTPERPRMPAGYGILAEPPSALPWETVESWLTRSRSYWVVTTRPDGRPHAMPVWGLWLDGAVWFSTDPASRKGRNLAARPDVVVHLESGDEVVVLEGVAEAVAAAPDALGAFVDAYEAKYAFRMELGTPPSGVYRVRPEIALAWTEADFPRTATRWTFPEGRAVVP